MILGDFPAKVSSTAESNRLEMEGKDASQPSDAELVATFRRTGRLEALDCLVRRHLARVNSMICRMGVGDWDADDLTQEVFLRAAKGLPGFRSGAQFSTWLYRITMNVTRTFLAHRNRTIADRATPPDEAVDSVSAPADKGAVGRELEDRIARALDALPPTLRAAIVLAALHEIPRAEAARIEGCSLPAMYWRVHKGRKLLKERLREIL